MSFPIQINATALTCPSFVVKSMPGRLDSRSIQALALEPGSYEFQSGAFPLNWTFTVTHEGHLDYVPELDVRQGGFLSGSGTTTLVVSGFRIALNGTSLATTNYAIANTTPWLPATASHTLHLLPGHYQFIQGNGPVPAVDFQVRMDGTIDYPVTSDAFLSGRGTATYSIGGFEITLDGTQLSTATYNVANITSWLPSKDKHTLHLLPGPYQFNQGNGPVPEADFEVRMDGTVDYAGTSDAFLTGRGTSTLVIIGLPITIDARQLAVETYALFVTTSWLLSKDPHTLYLLPGHYEFQQGNGVVSAAAFDVLGDGTVNYAESSNLFLSGRSTPNFGVIGLPITIDATRLTPLPYAVFVTAGWMNSQSLHRLNLLPGHYEFQLESGVVAAAAFDVRLDGTVDYPSTSDLFLGGRGTGTFEIVGLPVGVDVTAIAGTAVVLIPSGITLDKASAVIPMLRLLPQRNLGLALQSSPPLTALFDLQPNGSVELLEPVPFAALDHLDGHPVIRLTREVVRHRPPCRRPRPVPNV